MQNIIGISKNIKGVKMVYQGDGSDYKDEKSPNRKRMDDILGQ